MVRKVSVELGGTGVNTAAEATAVLGLHTSNSVIFSIVEADGGPLTNINAANLATGVLTAERLGDGGTLTNINAANVDVGVLADVQIPATVIHTDVIDQELGVAINFNQTELTDGATIDWDLANNQVTEVTLGDNRAMNAPTGLANGSFYSISVIQDGTGSRTLSWDALYLFTNGDAPTLSIGANAHDELVFKANASHLLETGRSLNVS